MQEKTKKKLLSFAVRGAVAVLLLLITWGISVFMPEIFSRIKSVWTESADIGKGAKLLKELFKEVLPF